MSRDAVARGRRRDRTAGPLRTCVGCRAVRPQSLLLRLARLPDGAAVWSRTGPGRGAWVCAASVTECLPLAHRRGGLARAFRAAVTSLPDDAGSASTGR